VLLIKQMHTRSPLDRPPSRPPQRPAPPHAEQALPARARWGAVAAISVSIFVQIAFHMLPIGLLTPIAADLGVSEGTAGHSMSIIGLFGFISSLCIPVLAGNLNRKTLLLILTALMVVSGLLTGLADGFALFMVSRALLGVAIGSFWTMSTGVALRLVPEKKSTQALAIFNAGNALAVVATAPLGSYLGELIGWRSAFLCLVPAAVGVLIWQWVSLPSLPPRRNAAQLRVSLRSMFGLLKKQLMLLGLAAIGLFYAGQFALFTYVRPYLEGVPGITPTTLSLVLLAPGTAGFLGSTVISRVIRSGLYRPLIGAPLLLGGIALAFVACQGQLVVVIGLLALWGFVATPAPVGWWTWVARSLPEEIEPASGLRVATIQAAMGLGATFGGLLYDARGTALTFAAAAALLFLGALAAWATKWRATTNPFA